MKSRLLFNEYTGYIKTDVLPFEIPIMYSNDEYYNYILKNSRKYKVLINKNYNRYSAPLSFKTFVREERKREISVISPIAYWRILAYIKEYESLYLDIFQKSKYSIRYHTKNKPKYIGKNFYTNGRIRRVEQRQTMYYKIEKFTRLYEFEQSDLVYNAMIKYRNCIRLDIKSCFDSIYTHSYKWIVSGNENGKELSKKHYLYKTDLLLQSINGHKTNGIVIGPEFSRMISELLLTHIDDEISKKLENIEVDCKIFRFVDDFFVFSRQEDTKKIVDIIKEELFQFQLQINDSKIERYEGVFIFNQWRIEISRYINDMNITKMSRKNKQELLDIISRYPQKRETVVSYLITSIVNSYVKDFDVIRAVITLTDKNVLSVEQQKKLRTKISQKLNDIELEEYFYTDYNLMKNILPSKANIYSCIELLLFYIKLAPKYINTLKLLHITIEILLIEKEISDKLGKYFYTDEISKYKFEEKHAFKNEILNAFNINFDFQHFIKEYPSESNNLFLLFELINYKINEKELEKLVEENKTNYLFLASVFRYAQSQEYEKLVNIITTKVTVNQCEVLKNYKDFLEKSKFWKLIIFNDQILFSKNFETLTLLLEKLENETDKKEDLVFLMKFLLENDKASNFFDFIPLNEKCLEDIRLINKNIINKMMIDINYE